MFFTPTQLPIYKVVHVCFLVASISLSLSSSSSPSSVNYDNDEAKDMNFDDDLPNRLIFKSSASSEASTYDYEDYHANAYGEDLAQVLSERHHTDEEKVARFVFQNYDSCTRPVFNASGTIDILFHFDLVSLTNMEEVKQLLETTAWMELVWIDEMLQWEPSQFNGVEEIRQPSAKLWMPDLILHNSAVHWQKVFSDKVQAVIHHSGTVVMGSFVKFKSTCMSVSNFLTFVFFLN